jgi:CRISPR-associated protein Cst2
MSDEETKEEIYSVEENGKEVGKIYIKKIKESDGGPYRVRFELAKDQKKKRIREVLAAISSGLYAQSSGEANTIIPLFLIAGAVKIPSPVFHPYIDIRRESGQWKVIGIGDALNNYWIEKSDGRPIVYISDSERLQVEPALKEGVEKSWEAFLEKIGLSGD